MAEPIVTIRLDADSSGVDRTFKQVKQKAQRDGSSIAESFNAGFAKLGLDFGGLAKGAGIIGAVTVAYKGLSNILETGFREAQATEDAINSLNIALKNTGQYTTRTSEELVKYAQSLSDITTVGDDAIISTSSLIQSLGNLDREGLKRATKATLDLSAALGIDLNSAAQLVGKAAAGEVGSLSRYGLLIEKGSTAAETFANVLNKLEGRFGGAAESKVETYSGAIAQLSIAFGDLSKAVAGYITQSSLIQGAIRLTTSLVRETTALINPDQGTIEERISGTIAKLEELRAKQDKYARLANIDSLGFKNDSQKNLEATQKEIQALEAKLEILRLQGMEGGTLNNQAIKTTVAGISPEELSKIEENARLVGLTQEQILIENLAKQQQIIADARENGLISEQSFQERSIVLEEQYQEQLTKLREGAAKKTMSFADQIRSSLKSGIANGAAQSFAAFGQALATGENALAAFAKAFVSSIGQIAVQQGNAFILQGIGYLFVPGFEGFGAGLIAAGAALATFGGVLGAVAGGGKGASAAAAGGGGGGVSGPSEVSAGFGLASQGERQEPETRVVVNIQGSVLDSDETGLRIANILKEASLNNNVQASVFA